ncbi:MAG TPA: helix-turn-helix domain-containing protein [Gaiellaceae bacterium]|nr:helix-turn-helix domain-containing protein [Gaiellaceae bacterium]
MRCRTCRPLPEEVARAADLLGRRWMLAILWASAEEGAVRFNEFKQALEGIPPRTLAARLAELEAEGILERRVDAATRPPRVEYRLTEAGRRLGAIVDAMRVYAGASAAISR